MAIIYGTDGDDALVGSAGNDTLDGGWGGEVLTGGAGADTSCSGAWQGGTYAGGPERITDFQLGIDRVTTTGDYGYQPWVMDAVQDGVAGTMLTWGWAADRVFIAGVTGVTVEQLTRRRPRPPRPSSRSPPKRCSSRSRRRSARTWRARRGATPWPAERATTPSAAAPATT
jgi:hypothetical protein